MNTQHYIRLFQSLNVNKTGAQRAPHKPILLLSIIDLIESNEIISPFIPISEQLERQFKINWKKYAPISDFYKCGMYNPFYHLSSSSFWHLIESQEYENKAPSSMKALRKYYQGAVIDVALFNELVDPYKRELFRSILINTYLSDTHSVAAEPLLSALALIGMFDWMALTC